MFCESFVYLIEEVNVFLTEVRGKDWAHSMTSKSNCSGLGQNLLKRWQREKDGASFLPLVLWWEWNGILRTAGRHSHGEETVPLDLESWLSKLLRVNGSKRRLPATEMCQEYFKQLIRTCEFGLGLLQSDVQKAKADRQGLAK